jgi:hypothetical protein
MTGNALRRSVFFPNTRGSSPRDIRLKAERPKAHSETKA